ncbi:DUF402 domain-containing protein [Occultella kanbiaonis]|uniref:DUF402 domain-containing protein n=1 Tax=Occultella kanbiaonis TaxID=2675754 RepID=UPI0012B8121F|nr:DUF402 domain-containing protein [Occultella kanbiaonis]
MLVEDAEPFVPGDSVAIRDVRGGVVRAVSAAVVVEHSPERLVTWIPLGSPLLLPGDVHGQPVKTERVDRLTEVSWNSWGGPAFVWPQGGWHSVRASWTDAGPDRSLDHWYVNLHTPLRRTSFGFDLEDLILDVIVKPDLRSWSWKDEAEFDEACADGIVEPDLAKIVRDTGTRVAGDAERGSEPFTEAWATWRPDPSWQLPTLPRGCTLL